MDMPAVATQPPARFSAPAKIPRFTVDRAPISDGWWGSLKVLFTRVGSFRSSNPIRIFTIPKPRKVSGSSMLESAILHGSFVALLVFLHQAFPPDISAPPQLQTVQRIFYRVPVRDSSKELPRIAPAGPGGQPGHAAQQAPPVLGSAALLTNLVAVSKPVRPDNSRQTIWQRNTPPDLIIPNEVKLPIIAVGNPNIAKPKAKIDPHDSKAIQAKKTYATQAAPSIDAKSSQPAVIPIANPTVLRPQFPIASGELAKPVQRSGSEQGSSVAPDIQSKGDPNLLVMGVDPSASANKIAIPAGNRWGDFSLSPAGTQPGSPGGTLNNGKPGGGASGADGAGGDGSVGIGAGKTGGGGDSSGDLPVSLTGRNTAPATYGGLSSFTTEEMIVPVIT